MSCKNSQNINTPMETPKQTPKHDYLSTVDTSRPFRSVKEAVAIFGERILVGEIYSSSSSSPSPKPNNYNDHISPSSNVNSSPTPPETTPKLQNDDDDIVDSLKRVEAELEETKAELRQLREREQETEVAVASLNAELHKNMSRLEAAEAAKAAAGGGGGGGGITTSTTNCTSSVDRDKEERWRSELKKKMEKNTTLAQILSIGLGEKDVKISNAQYHDFGKKLMMKKKPIIPLVGDLFSRKKAPTTRTTTKYS